MPLRLEYKHHDKPKDNQQKQEDAFPSTRVLLIPAISISSVGQ